LHGGSLELATILRDKLLGSLFKFGSVRGATITQFRYANVRSSAYRRNSCENHATDSIIEDVWRVREEAAAKHGFDARAILAAAKSL
jgi:hypothetical protein